MLETLLPILRCPYTGDQVSLSKDGLYSRDRKYAVIEGIPSLVLDEKVATIDQVFQEQYDERTARVYDRTLRLQSLALGCWEPAERRRLIQLLNPPHGGRVLEVSVGTGANLRHLTRAIGSDGQIIGVDLSLAMLQVALKRLKKIGSSVDVQLIRADGCHLPFADNSFDAVFHFGGINMFGDVGLGIAEMVRVTKFHAPIVISDEGMSEKRRKSMVGQRLGKMNSLNLCRPPFTQVPWTDIYGFELHWAWRELMYVLRFKKGGLVNTPAENARAEIRRRVGLL